LWLGSQPTFALGTWPSLVKNLVVFAILILPNSFFVIMNGLVFERLRAMRPIVQPKKLTIPVIVSVVGWSIGWLLMSILVVIIMMAFSKDLHQ
jgi:hypothetical protein